MKQILVLLIVFLMCFGAMAQVTTTGKTLNYPSRAEVNAAFSTKKDTVTATNYFYTKAKSDSIKTFGRTYLNTLKAMGSTIKTVTVGANLNYSGSCPLVDGQISFIRLEIVPFAQTLYDFKFILQTSGAYVPTAGEANQVFLAKRVGTTYTIVAATTNDVSDPNIFEGTINWVISKSFATPYAAAANEILYIGFIYNGTGTAPIIYGANGVNARLNDPAFWGLPNFISGRILTPPVSGLLPASFTHAECTQTAYFPLVTIY